MEIKANGRFPTYLHLLRSEKCVDISVVFLSAGTLSLV